MRSIRGSVLAIAMLLSSTAAYAQQDRVKGWVDVNFGVAASGAGEEAFAFTDIVTSEPLVAASAYGKPPTGGEFDFGGGYMFTRQVGLGVSFTGTAHRDVAGLAITVPHPFFFNASASDASVTEEKLDRTEGAANIQVMFVPVESAHLRFRVFGGPSYFRYQSDMVGNIRFDQVAPFFSPLNLVAITGYETTKTEGTGWGFHVGADGTYFFSRVVGVGGFARFSRGTVTVDEPMSETSQELKTGGFQTGGGLRLRF
jgi:hypothetical protein